VEKMDSLLESLKNGKGRRVIVRKSVPPTLDVGRGSSSDTFVEKVLKVDL
jgi:hypothetical protein